MIRLENVHGPDLLPYLETIGELRITVFREYPYLYDGSLEYERDYLKTYLECEQSLAVLAYHGQAIIGVTTCLPMTAADGPFRESFERQGYDLNTLCYLGESVLLPSYRGRGIGKQFFQRREAHARTLGASHTTFCSVDRDDAHPQRPPHYRPLNDFWTSQGYERIPELRAQFSWKEIHEPEESLKTLTFWLKSLT